MKTMGGGKKSNRQKSNNPKPSKLENLSSMRLENGGSVHPYLSTQPHKHLLVSL